MPGAHFVLTRVRKTLVVTLQNAADASTLSAASQALMDELGQHGAEGVVFEVSGCELIDLDEFSSSAEAGRDGGMAWRQQRGCGFAAGHRCLPRIGGRIDRRPPYLAQSRASPARRRVNQSS